MNVQELINLLENLDPDLEVYMSEGEECRRIHTAKDLYVWDNEESGIVELCEDVIQASQITAFRACVIQP